MILLPAIDLKNQQAVRLTKGLMDSAKVYSSSPLEVAQNFYDMGATWLHVVDLDGAFNAKPVNLAPIKEILKNTKLKVEIGGGIRTEDTIKAYFDLGVSRVILGSVAVSDVEFTKKMAQKYKIAVGIDAQDGIVKSSGWAENTSVKALDLAKTYSDANLDAIICTDISKDGTLSGVNVDFTLAIKDVSNVFTIASGGIKDLQDLKALEKTQKIDGAIIGKAFYEKKLDIQEALKIFM